MTQSTQSPTWCRTASGVGFDLFNLDAHVAQLEDVAHHLAMLCRYGGATPVFYSVAQHAVLVARCVYMATQSAALALLALHHDDGEAYLYDIRRPHKPAVWFAVGATGVRAPFSQVEDLVHAWVLRALLPADLIASAIAADAIGAWVRRADDTVLRAEYLGLFPDAVEGLPAEDVLLRCVPVLPVDAVSWERAKSEFLRMHHFFLREYAAAVARSARLQDTNSSAGVAVEGWAP